MDLDTLQDTWATALAGSTAIAAWCVTNGYGAHTVVKTTDLENLPDIEDYPVIALDYGRKVTGVGQDNEELQLGVGVGVFDASDPVVTGNIEELLGRKRCEQLRKLVVAAIAATDMAGGYVALVETEHEPVELSGFFLCAMAITVLRPYQFRDNRLL